MQLRCQKKNPRASACLRCREGSLWIFGATKSPLLCPMGGQSLSLWLLSFRTLNFTSGKYFLHAENGPFLLCYSENTKCGGARPLSSLYVSGTTNGAPTRDRSIVLNGLIKLSTHTRKTALCTSEQYSLQVATSPLGHSKLDGPLTIDAFHPSLHLLTTYISNVPIFRVLVLLGSCIHK